MPLNKGCLSNHIQQRSFQHFYEHKPSLIMPHPLHPDFSAKGSAEPTPNGTHAPGFESTAREPLEMRPKGKVAYRATGAGSLAIPKPTLLHSPGAPRPSPPLPSFSSSPSLLLSSTLLLPFCFAFLPSLSSFLPAFQLGAVYFRTAPPRTPETHTTTSAS